MRVLSVLLLLVGCTYTPLSLDSRLGDGDGDGDDGGATGGDAAVCEPVFTATGGVWLNDNALLFEPPGDASVRQVAVGVDGCPTASWSLLDSSCDNLLCCRPLGSRLVCEVTGDLEIVRTLAVRVVLTNTGVAVPHDRALTILPTPEPDSVFVDTAVSMPTFGTLSEPTTLSDALGRGAEDGTTRGVYVQGRTTQVDRTLGLDGVFLAGGFDADWYRSHCGCTRASWQDNGLSVDWDPTVCAPTRTKVTAADNFDGLSIIEIPDDGTGRVAGFQGIHVSTAGTTASLEQLVLVTTPSRAVIADSIIHSSAAPHRGLRVETGGAEASSLKIFDTAIRVEDIEGDNAVGVEIDARVTAMMDRVCLYTESDLEAVGAQWSLGGLLAVRYSSVASSAGHNAVAIWGIPTSNPGVLEVDGSSLLATGGRGASAVIGENNLTVELSDTVVHVQDVNGANTVLGVSTREPLTIENSRLCAHGSPSDLRLVEVTTPVTAESVIRGSSFQVPACGGPILQAASEVQVELTSGNATVAGNLWCSSPAAETVALELDSVGVVTVTDNQFNGPHCGDPVSRSGDTSTAIVISLANDVRIERNWILPWPLGGGGERAFYARYLNGADIRIYSNAVVSTVIAATDNIDQAGVVDFGFNTTLLPGPTFAPIADKVGFGTHANVHHNLFVQDTRITPANLDLVGFPAEFTRNTLLVTDKESSVEVPGATEGNIWGMYDDSLCNLDNWHFDPHLRVTEQHGGINHVFLPPDIDGETRSLDPGYRGADGLPRECGLPIAPSSTD